MKMMKKIAMIALAVCLMIPCFSMLTHAQDGRITFSDNKNPAVATGAEVEVKVTVQKWQGTFVDIDIVMTYDTDLLEFKSGTDVTETAPGTLHYVGDARNDGASKQFTMRFRALKAGTTVIEVKSSEIKDSAGAVKNYIHGTSTIVIEGETVSDHPGNISEETVEVNGKEYHFAAKVPAIEIPEGYEEAVLTYGPKDYNVIYNEDLELYLAYLVDENSQGALFMYVEENATFAPYQSLQISNQTMIVLLSDVTEIYLPDEYKFYADAITVNGQEFPGWKKADKPGYCIIYALNNHGQKALYEVDVEENTYQRFEAPRIVREEKGLLATLTGMLENHLDRVIIFGGFAFLFFILVIMVLSVKLYNRNVELDEVYDKYGFDDETEGDEDSEDDEDDYQISTDDSEELDLFVEDIDAFLPQEMREIFPEEQKQSTQEIVVEVSKELKKDTVEKEPEMTLGNVLAQQKQEVSDEDPFEDDDILENFMMDFIDLDD